MYKKSQGLPINVLVMIIIGIILFGMSLMIFQKFSNKGEEELTELENKIKNNLENLECEDGGIICVPTIVVKNGERSVSNIVIVNKLDAEKNFLLEINVSSSKGGAKSYQSQTGLYYLSNNCGTIEISFPIFNRNIKSGKGASDPIVVKATNVNNVPCTFVTVARVRIGTSDYEKTPIVIRVEE